MPALQPSVDGIAAVERAILQEAAARQLPGLRLEWNEDQDFAHLMDPVPVVLMTTDGKSVEASFSAQELDDFVAGNEAGARDKIDTMLDDLAQQPGGEVHGESRGF
ncbi:MAG: hypothetical protein IT532_00865 [Burkholderiales bacterium]|nr:hypothetical protein [Burkholderiales bacterium]